MTSKSGKANDIFVCCGKSVGRHGILLRFLGNLGLDKSSEKLEI